MEAAAGSIGDPVQRLRFLQSVAPIVDVSGERSRRRRILARAVLLLCASVVALVSASMMRATARVAPPAPRPGPAKPLPPSGIWRVEDDGASEVYSNGLRVDNTFMVSCRPRSYVVYSHAGRPEDRRTDPAGIVFHGTESAVEPFEAGHNEALKRIGESLLDYVRRRRSYHFVIDRFGRVYRVVRESDAAHHAGHSVWADDRWLYVGLNDSFLGVAFEARTAGEGVEPEMTAAQARSGATLIEMLRARHRLPAVNCVTHAQVSVNPSNGRLGYHVDWAAAFPFAELGLPDNYAIPPAAVWAFGFKADAAYRRAAGETLRRALDAPAARARLDYRRISAGDTSGRKKNTIPRIR